MKYITFLCKNNNIVTIPIGTFYMTDWDNNKYHVCLIYQGDSWEVDGEEYNRIKGLIREIK
jgi:hypothetical protein